MVGLDTASARSARLHSAPKRAAAVALVVILSLMGCSSAGGSESAPIVDNAQAVAGTILRVIHGRDIGELRITEMTAPDTADPPYPSCLTKHPASQRVVNFDLNWAGVNFGEGGPAPSVRITITGTDGTPPIAEIPRAGPTNDCQTVKSFQLHSEDKGWQLGYGMTLRQPSNAKLSHLSVYIDGQFKDIPLSPVCDQSGCFQADPPLPWISGTPYSVSLKL